MLRAMEICMLLKRTKKEQSKTIEQKKPLKRRKRKTKVTQERRMKTIPHTLYSQQNN